jgi:hypothetical protein
MALLTRVRKQTAVYWAPSAGRDKFGHPKLEPAKEITCRWDDVTEEFVDAVGTRVAGRSVVIVDVDDDVKIGGVLMLGTLNDITSTVAKNNEGAYEVRRVDKTPNIHNTQTLVEAYL